MRGLDNLPKEAKIWPSVPRKCEAGSSWPDLWRGAWLHCRCWGSKALHGRHTVPRAVVRLCVPGVAGQLRRAGPLSLLSREEEEKEPS